VSGQCAGPHVCKVWQLDDARLGFLRNRGMGLDYLDCDDWWICTT
jgi:hypothetical protein